MLVCHIYKVVYNISVYINIFDLKSTLQVSHKRCIVSSKGPKGDSAKGGGGNKPGKVCSDVPSIPGLAKSGPSPRGLEVGKCRPNIFKKGDRSKAANYRPVSLTCICYKLLEDIVSSNIMQTLRGQ